MVVEVEKALLPYLPQGFTEVSGNDPIIQEKMTKQKEMIIILDVYTHQLTPVDIDTYNALINHRNFMMQTGQPYYGPSLLQLQNQQNRFQQQIVNPYMQQGFTQPQVQIDPITNQPMPTVQTRHVKASQHEAETSGDPVSKNDIDIPDNPNEAIQMIDNIINTIQLNNENAPVVDWGVVRYGNESMGALSHNELINHCLNKAFEYAPVQGLNYNLMPTLNGLIELGIFYNGEKKDRFIIDPYFFGGKGMPMIYADLVKYDSIGKVCSSKKLPIPLGYTYALRQILFKSIPGQPQGVTEDVYNQMRFSMYRDLSTYNLIDTSIVGLPDDIMNYKEFGDKIQAINAVYPFKARYRLHRYVDNNNFILKSDQNVIQTLPDQMVSPEPLDVKITVSGNKLTIEEPNNNTINIEL